jgi:hypothetical protein
MSEVPLYGHRLGPPCVPLSSARGGIGAIGIGGIGAIEWELC